MWFLFGKSGHGSFCTFAYFDVFSLKSSFKSCQKPFSTYKWCFEEKKLGFREMYKRMLKRMTFYMIFHKSTRNLIWFQMKTLRKIISVENPCGNKFLKCQVHICCRYEVINHRECAFLPFSSIYSCFASGQKLCCEKRNKGITAWRWTLRSDC